MSSKARQDIRDIHYYISNSLMEKNIADKIITRILNRMERLRNMPKSCSKIQGEYKEEYRKLVINHYLAIYRVNDNNKEVYIVKVVYGGRNYFNSIYE